MAVRSPDFVRPVTIYRPKKANPLSWIFFTLGSVVRFASLALTSYLAHRTLSVQKSALGLLLYAFKPFALFCFHKISAHFFGVSSSFGLRPHSTQNPLFPYTKMFKNIFKDFIGDNLTGDFV